MRSTLKIIVAVKDQEPVTEEELKMALLVMSAVNYFANNKIEALVRSIERNKMREYAVAEAKKWRESEFEMLKNDPLICLGRSGIPGTPENNEQMRMSRQIYKAVTGEEL